jgi:hypothetical protein
MKKLQLTICGLIILATFQLTFADQTAIQIINNLPYPKSEKMTVIIGGYDYSLGGMSFGKGTQYFPTTGTEMVSLTHPEINDFSLTFPTAPTPEIYIFSGVKTPANYSNPYNRTISIKAPIPYPIIGKQLVSGSSVYFTIYHGSTDAPKLKIQDYNTEANWYSGLDYLEATGYTVSAKDAKDYTLDFFDYNKDTVIATFDVDLTNYGNKVFCMVLGGFLDSTKNQNGPGLTLYGVFSDGTCIVFPRIKTQSHASASAPILVSPTNGASNVNLADTLRWNKVKKATSYKMQLSIKSDFSNYLYNETVTDTFYVYDGLAGNKVFYWHVASVNSTGSSSWSETRSFTTKADLEKPIKPTLSSPELAAKKVSLIGKLEWNKVTDADYYNLQVATNNGFNNLIIDKYNLTNNYYEYKAENGEQLTLNTKYFWRVKAGNSVGLSDWSDYYYFTTIDDVSITDNNNSNIITELFPNPITDVSELIVYNKNNSDISLDIYSMTGKLVKNYSYKNINDVIKIPINKNDFQIGMYFYKLKINNEVYFDKILISY